MDKKERDTSWARKLRQDADDIERKAKHLAKGLRERADKVESKAAVAKR